MTKARYNFLVLRFLYYVLLRYTDDTKSSLMSNVFIDVNIR